MDTVFTPYQTELMESVLVNLERLYITALNAEKGRYDARLRCIARLVASSGW